MKNERSLLQERKGTVIGLVMCFVAAVIVYGAFSVQKYKGSVEKEMVKKEEQSTIVNESDVINPKKEPEVVKNNPPEVPKADQPSIVNEPHKQAPKPAAGHGEINFTDEDIILWPINGDVILSYNMDKTVYFATLDQYKYNPAMIIAAEEGQSVLSAAKGIVKSLEVTAQTGTTLTVDLGNGYEAIYGQLKEVPVKTGDYVEAKTVLGYIEKPTKYYSVEGCNLYFEMRKEGQPVNPLEYLE